MQQRICSSNRWVTSDMFCSYFILFFFFRVLPSGLARANHLHPSLPPPNDSMSSFTTPPLCSSSRPPSCPYQPQHPKMDWFKESICMFHLLQVSCRMSFPTQPFKQTKKTRERVFCFVFCHYLRKMLRLVSAVFFWIAASLLWLVLLSAVFLPVANLTDPLGRPHPQLPDILWRRKSQMCSLSPSSGCFSALILFSVGFFIHSFLGGFLLRWF